MNSALWTRVERTLPADVVNAYSHRDLPVLYEMTVRAIHAALKYRRGYARLAYDPNGDMHVYIVSKGRNLLLPAIRSLELELSPEQILDVLASAGVAVAAGRPDSVHQFA